MATIKDVAKYANVGIATVSRVLNNSGYVSKETKEDVLRAIKELGYVPNELARNFQKKQTNIIGLIIPSSRQQFSAELLYHLESTLYNLGFHTLVGISNHDDGKEIEYLEKLKSQQVAGIIITAPFISVDKSYLYKDLPIVSVDRQINEFIPCVHIDNFKAAYEISEVLLKKARKKVVYVGLGADSKSVAMLRKDGFIKCATNHKIDYALTEMVYEEKDLDYIKRVYQEHLDCDGFFFGCDYHARLFISYVQSINIKVNEDIFIVGFDGLFDNDSYSPNLTTVKQPLNIISQAVVSALMKRINHVEVNNDIIIDHEILIGDTCK